MHIHICAFTCIYIHMSVHTCILSISLVLNIWNQSFLLHFEAFSSTHCDTLQTGSSSEQEVFIYFMCFLDLNSKCDFDNILKFFSVKLCFIMTSSTWDNMPVFTDHTFWNILNFTYLDIGAEGSSSLRGRQMLRIKIM